MLKIPDFVLRSDKMISTLRQLVETESPTEDRVAVNRMGALIGAELSLLGAHVTAVSQAATGDHYIGRWRGGSNQKGILLLCHMDTVHPMGSLDKNPCRERDGKLFGPGTQDMKAGIAMLLVALKTLREAGQWPAWPITALFTSDEETGSLTSRALIEKLAREADLVLCLEPCLPGGELKTWRKGVGDFDIIVRGRAAHAGASHPEGRNAIEELAHQVIAIQGMTDYEQGTTLNVGVIQGGTASNVVPSEARATVDLRVVTQAEAERIQSKMQSLKAVLNDTSIEVSGGLNRPPMPRDERMVAAFQQAQRIAERLGLRLAEGGTGGGSDANFVAPLGIPVLDGLGAMGNGQHTEREHVVLVSLPERAALLAALLTGWQFS